MCTVTYVTSGNKVIITSNRDEHVGRPSSVHPQVYYVNRRKVIFPKDPKAGGTWFAVDENANIAVLLNGAVNRHEVAETYRKSRGIVLLDILTAQSQLEIWKVYDADGIEPFTIILLWESALYQLRWDSRVKETVSLNAKDHHIWSSCTLYTPAMHHEREIWFEDFLKTGDKSPDLVKDFHLHTDEGNTETGLVINRGGIMKTFSITQAVIEYNKADLFHYDLLDHRTFNNSFVII